MLLTLRELEILKSALELDIIYQKNRTLPENYTESKTADFEAWLKDTEYLLKRIRSEISDIKLQRASGNYEYKESDLLRYEKTVKSRVINTGEFKF